MPIQKTTRELAEYLSAELDGDDGLVISGVGSLGQATATEITYLTRSASATDLASCRAGAVLFEADRGETAAGLNVSARLIVSDAQAAFLQLLALFRPPASRPAIGCSGDACVGERFVCGQDTNVYPGAMIGDDVTLGDRCDIFPGSVIGDGCRLGDDVTLHPGGVLYPGTQVGDRVIVHANAVIGSDGFGYRFVTDEDDPHGHFLKIPHSGLVRLEDDVEIGAGTTVDRGMIDATVIGAGTKLDNQVMIAHNCRVGPHNVFASQVGLAGSVTTGGYVRCGGQTGIADHLELGEGCSIAAKSAVTRDVPPGETHLGYPAGPKSRQQRVLISQQKLPELLKTVAALTRRVEELEAAIEANASRPAA